MNTRIILASQSEIRQQLLTNAQVPHVARPANLDEAAIRDALLAEQAPARDIADALAEAKATKLSAKEPAALVIGCDQVLAHQSRLLSKPATPEEALAQLITMRGSTHELFSAVVIYEDGTPQWRHVARVRMTMRDLSDSYLKGYVTRNWDSIRHTVGCYKLEEEGARLFSRVDGDYFSVLGLPLLDLISYLSTRGELET
ncbi:Maf family protein [Roseovarius sp. ZX-A-9]|uniref:Maf family protein n=1 Tax=Roseovarius sp. ZX-A-9 TaxID=3014783 RepID=UPI00232C8D3D|nr:nucleoside triphosphate pyrophosphatase [Roseovarius sp. ZX-A-9]